MEKERIHLLKNLTLQNRIEMMEALIGFGNELHEHFLPDNPYCLKIALNKSKKINENRKSIRQGS